MPTLRIAGRTGMFAGESWQAALAIGCASVLLGAVIMVWPNKSVQVAAVLFALVLLATAAWQTVVAFRARIRRGLRVLELLTAMLALLLAVWCLQSGDWVSLLALWVGIGWVSHGITQAMVAVWSDHLPHTGRQEIAGLLTMVAGVLVIVWPIDTLAGLSVLVGFCLILLGITEIRIAARIDRPAAAAGGVGVHGILRSQPERGA
ncbi:DUF308 domain-containing protein [Nocardia terpenica]|uniref:HdeD family acid-resistance protein n=1 Tax=Nocardia terpenica TaxID=455432 RepID=UPI001895AD7D|nr:DUF308 domain-containing protein [Nocardia terpenica]MBF6059177.1 DUF308 domain-containing protein [Nocardia terpenica]MBF6103284.1 DUF308 domain-containing protein [Nocardia terpenica]MBF6110527.1 DUF308 domain-containing protein [Nocardia terpenica]MBF6116658.1 DUF308 domain-containing protein [Nocardia terpenica]